MSQVSDEQWAGVPIPLNIRPDSGVRVIVTTPLAPDSVPGLAGPSDPSVVATRVTFFPGRTAPWVEIWVRRPSECCDLDTPSVYTYYDIHRPPCDTQEQWLALLATGQTTVLTPPPETPIYYREPETDTTWVPGADGQPLAIPELRGTKESDLGLIADGEHATLIDRAKARHDRECNCDPKHLMTCPRMAQAILDAGPA